MPEAWTTVDDLKIDVISTDRQSLNWDLPKTTELRVFLKKTMSELERKWRDKRNEIRKERIKQKSKVDISDWYEKLPQKILSNIQTVLNTLDNKSELPDLEFSDVVKRLHLLVPEYPYYHWRLLHEEVKNASKKDYINKDYYHAFLEAAKRYINKTKEKSGSHQTSDAGLMGEVFGKNKRLSVTKKYKKPDNTEFSDNTKENIEEGQKFLSMGIVKGGRNPISHEEIKDLRDSNLFSEKDCLDALSLLSHLFKRLDDAE